MTAIRTLTVNGQRYRVAVEPADVPRGNRRIMIIVGTARIIAGGVGPGPVVFEEVQIDDQA